MDLQPTKLSSFFEAVRIANHSGYGHIEAFCFILNTLGERNIHGSTDMQIADISVKLVDEETSTLFKGRI